MGIKAFKMDGLGNDFVIIDQRENSFDLSKDQIIKICDRNYIGCDQLILIKKNRKIDAGVEFYNSNGSFTGACGNGTRCVASLLAQQKNKKEIILWTSSGILKSNILENNLVETEIGVPKTKWDEIPLSKNLNTQNLDIKIKNPNNLNFQDHDITMLGGTAVNVGNPHVVFFVENIENFDLKNIGPKIENHKIFPEKCNVTLAKIINENLIKVKVWERGAGLTKACGTAACATAVAAKLNEFIKNKTNIEFELGKISIFIDKKNSIFMKGPVSNIKEIEIKF